MKNIFYRSDGQVAPFMIAIIVVLIMALMVTANIGKVGITKTNTANAADAGALAGSSTHANTLNNLAKTNSLMLSEYAAALAAFRLPDTICREWVKYITYLAFVALQQSQFALALDNAKDGYREARNAAKEFAFSNAGIDEPKKRLLGESYEDYLNRDSNFQIWMKNKGYKSSDIYVWTDKDGKENSFRVEVDAPDFPGLVPMPGVLFAPYRDGPFPVCWDCFECCKICEAALETYRACLVSTGADVLGGGWLSLIGKNEVGILDPKTGCAKCEATISIVSSGGIMHRNPLTWILPSRAACPHSGVGLSVINKAFYSVPIAFIANIVSDNPRITVTTTRVEPNADLGLWEMKYGTISSSATAESKGGSIAPVPIPRAKYMSHLVAGGY